MTAGSRDGKTLRVDLLISRLLRTGVFLSVVIVLAGVVVTFVHHPDYFSSRPALGKLIDAEVNYTSSVRAVLSGVRELRGQSIAMLGLLVLIATPVARVAVSIAVFAVERDPVYVCVTTAVLVLLILSFFLGTG